MKINQNSDFYDAFPLKNYSRKAIFILQVRLVSFCISDHPKVRTYTDSRDTQIFQKSKSHLKK
jgi:hypothetical protein